MKPIYWLVVSGVFFALGEWSSKKWAIQPGWKEALAVVASYVACTLCWLPAIRQTNHLSSTGTLWSAASLVTTVAIGLAFGEHLGSRQVIGIFFAVVAIILLS